MLAVPPLSVRIQPTDSRAGYDGSMVRVAIIGVVVAVAFTLYALIDAAMSEPSRARGVSKPVWVVLTVVLPVIGGILWFTIGRGSRSRSGRLPDPTTTLGSPRRD